MPTETAVKETRIDPVPDIIGILTPARSANDSVGGRALKEFCKVYNGPASIEAASKAAKRVEGAESFIEYQVDETAKVLGKLLDNKSPEIPITLLIDEAMSEAQNINDLRLALGRISLGLNPQAQRMLAELDRSIKSPRPEPPTLMERVTKKREVEPEFDTYRKALGTGVKELTKITPEKIESAERKVEGRDTAESTVLLKSLLAGRDVNVAGDVHRALMQSMNMAGFRTELGIIALNYNPAALMLLGKPKNDSEDSEEN
ncbi:MAG: hypothetical protein V1744_08630 [Candidatus Altiarchaeota archaeon]